MGDELSKLKEKQAKRKEIRLEQEKKLNQQKREEEEKMKAEEAERKAKEAEEKKKRLEEAEAKRQEMLEAQKAQKADAADKKKSIGGGDVTDARKELSKTKEQLEEEKKIALSIRIKPLDLEAMDSDELKAKAEELFKIIIQLETDKYDYEQRKLTQELDLKELKERQKAQLRQKALKKGLDPEAFVGKYPPMIRMYSKYERRTDTRTYDDRKKLYEGGWEVIRAESLDAIWKESTKNGPRGHQRSFLSGSVRGQARKLEMLRPLRVRKREVRKHLQRMSMMRKKRRRRKRRRKKKSKHCSQKTSDLSTNCASLSICSKPT